MTQNPHAAGRPVILLGAARSGTKLLRAILGAHSRLAAVPYDINYVWLLGNHRLGHDELEPTDLNDKTAGFIRGFVDRFRGDDPNTRVVEKTVSNTLRVPFVDAVFPEARYVVLLRDGRDVAASAREQWQARPAGASIATKLKTFPVQHAWRYGLDYLVTYAASFLPGRRALRSWGPRYRGIDTDLATRTVLEVCALQWCRCVEATAEGLKGVATERVHHVRYEELVQSPLAVTSGILAFLGTPADPAVEDFCRTRVSGTNVGKWRRQLTADEERRVAAIVEPVMARAGLPLD